MRAINYIVLHCTGASQSQSVRSILDYWKGPPLFWKNPGYHFLIEADGTIHNLQAIEKPSNGVGGHNANSIHVCYIGGVDAKNKPLDNRTPRQILSMVKCVVELKEMFPKAAICGHKDFEGVNKACPSFDVKTWLQGTGLKFK